MCGIAGVIGVVDDENRRALARMQSAMAHRGPDASGAWESDVDDEGWGVLLGHLRLSILDLSPSGAQPMLDPARQTAIVTNGEIYNYRQLRTELAGTGAFESSGDTEVMLRWLGTRGAGAVGALRGMFAAAFYDGARRQTVLLRDPLGIKPLYVAHNPDPSGRWSVIWASEVRALLASGLLADARLDPSGVAAMVWNGFVVGPNTAVAGVSEVMPGTAVVLGERGRTSQTRTYWEGSADAGSGIDDDEMAAALHESVGLHLASDVPLAVFLSSGVDSASLANLARREAGREVNTFTLSFDHQEHDEGPAAQRIAAAIGSRHHEVTLTEADVVARLDDASDCLDQPSFDGINTYFMSHAVRSAGFTVALSGAGGDELFGGYETFRTLPRYARWGRLTPATGVQSRLARAVADLAGRRDRRFELGGRISKAADMVARQDDLVRQYQMAYGLFVPAVHRRLVGGAAADGVIDGLPPSVYEQLHADIAGKPALPAVSHLESSIFLRSRLLRDADMASMAASLELRVPLVDSVLVDAAHRMDPVRRFEPVGSKPLLRKVGLAGLDPGLFTGPKRGFVLPWERWFRGDAGRGIDETLRDRRLVAAAGLEPATVERVWQTFLDHPGAVYWTRPWALYAHVRWCAKHGLTV